MADTTEWIRTDAATDTVEGLRLLGDLLPRTSSDPYGWVWVIIVLHRTVQASLLDCLGTASVLDRIDDEAAEQMYESIHGRAKPPPQRMVSPRRLYERARERNSWPPSPDIDRDLQLLSELRDSLLHPLASLHSIQVAGLPRMVGSALGAVARSVSTCAGWQTHGRREDAERLLDGLKCWRQP